MTPRTRNSNKDTNFKVYYSKTIPQQVHFPHKRKTVRRPSEPVKDGSDKRQIKFLPEMMRAKTEAADSSYEDDENVKEGDVTIVAGIGDLGEDETASRGKVAKTRNKKRRSDAMKSDSEGDDEAATPNLKHRRNAATPKASRHPKQLKPEPEEDKTTSASTERQIDRARTLRRQSTMTQLVEGRRPLSDTEEPAFKPVKRKPRSSWAGQDKQAKDKKQRTLTQMVPGMKPIGIVSDDDKEEGLSDSEAEERESQLYGAAVAARLAREGLMQNNSDDLGESHNEDYAPSKAQIKGQNRDDNDASLYVSSIDVPSLLVHSVEDDQDEDDEESYQPTQFIDAPITRTRRSPRGISGLEQRAPYTTAKPPTDLRTKGKARFGLLSTPEKRRIREIPSSQSPPDSPLYTQVSPSKGHRLPLKERSGNATQVAETPSRHKQVTFQEVRQEPAPPPSLRKFKSVIQDSEDEDDDLLEMNENESGPRTGEHTQALARDINYSEHGTPVGTETQAILDRIDLACIPAHEDEAWPTRESSEKPNISMVSQSQSKLSPEPREQDSPDVRSPFLTSHTRLKQEGSPELGEQSQQRNNTHNADPPNLQSAYFTAHVGVKQEQSQEVQTLDLSGPDLFVGEDVLSVENAEPASTSIGFPDALEQVPSSPPIFQQPIEDTCPSTPMVIMDSSDDDEVDDPDVTPPHQNFDPVSQLPSTALQHSADLDGESIQVPRSPTAQHETQQSHSSKAELQLQNEWFSYSQYINARPPQSSSMNVAQDKFSYHATPMPPRPAAQTQTQHYMSQATTVDEVTPRKNKTQRNSSAHTTPHKVASSQPTSSPSKPPPLFIPSSFPSPAKARMDEWSSPLFGRTQDMYSAGGSLEDFSIPLPPPLEDDWMDGG
jgi:hypothetical protein